MKILNRYIVTKTINRKIGIIEFPKIRLTGDPGQFFSMALSWSRRRRDQLKIEPLKPLTCSCISVISRRAARRRAQSTHFFKNKMQRLGGSAAGGSLHFVLKNMCFCFLVVDRCLLFVFRKGYAIYIRNNWRK